MKKNITINLCGRLFNIDEDACQLLQNYLDALHDFFGKQAGGEEIADDIEQRVAELLDEQKAAGIEAVTIEHIKDIINRIGQPEQMGEEASPQPSSVGGNGTGEPEEGLESASDNASDDDSYGSRIKSFFTGKRLYRNPKNQMLTGVCSGLANYFEVDVTLLRLLTIVLMVASHGFFLLAYVILALVMPAAETPEQQLKMQGKPVNLSNLASEMVQDVGETVSKAKESSPLKRVVDGFLRFCVGVFKAVMVLLAGILFFAGVGVLLWALMCIFAPNSTQHFFGWETGAVTGENLPMFVGFLIASVTSLLIPAYAIVQYLVRPMKAIQCIVLLAVWIVALAVMVVFGSLLDEQNAEYHRQQMCYYEDMQEKQQNDSVYRFSCIC